MSERMTAISLPGVWGAGWAEYGRKSIPEMLDGIRRRAANEKAIAEQILAAPDEAFFVETYIGVHARNNRQVLQAPSSTPSDQSPVPQQHRTR